MLLSMTLFSIVFIFRYLKKKDMTSEIQQRIIDEAYLELVKFTIKDWKLVPTERCRICRDGVHDPPIEYDVEFKTKNVYRGGFLNDEKKLQGKGKFRWPNRTKYQGEFQDNLITGFGRMICEDQSKYIGEFKAGFRHGEGYYFNENIKYRGRFNMGNREGFGTLVTDENNKFEGISKNNKRFEGLRTYENGTFKGIFDQNETRKFGKYQFDNGDTYDGNWTNGLFSGYGVYTWFRSSDKAFDHIESDYRTHKFYNRYLGYWLKNTKHGCGILQHNGFTLIALWKNGIKWGPGILFAKNGEVYVSNVMFESDQYVSSEKVYVNPDSREQICAIIEKYAVQNKEKNFIATIKTLCAHHTFCNNPRAGAYPFYFNAFAIDLENTPILRFVSGIYPEVKLDDIITKEKTSLNHVLRDYITLMSKIYTNYACWGYKDDGDEDNVEFITMTRLGLYQFYRDLELSKKGENICAMVDGAEQTFSIIRLNKNNPYEPVMFCDFIKHLLYVTYVINMNKNVQNRMKQERPSYLGLFATMLSMVLRDFIIPLKSFSVGLMPSIIKKDPQLLANVYELFKEKSSSFSLRNVFQFFTAVKNGTNWLCDREFDVDFTVFYNRIDYMEFIEPYIPEGMSFFENLTYEDCFKCCYEYFPEIVKENVIVKSDFNITFLDFFEIIFILMRANYKRDIISVMLTRESLKTKLSKSSRTSKISKNSKKSGTKSPFTKAKN